MKRLLFLLLFLFFPNFLFATNYVDEFPIYVFGDVRPIAAIFNIIAFVSNDNLYDIIIYISIIFSIVFNAYLMMYRSSILTPFKSGVFIIGTVSILLVPVDVHIVDKRLDAGILNPQYHAVALGYEKVSNVPYLVAIGPSVVTTVSQDLITLINDTFGGNTISYSGMKDIGKIGYATIGFGSAWQYIDKILNKFSFDEIGTLEAGNFEEDFKHYIKNCVIPKSASDSTVKQKLIAPTKSIFSALAPLEIGLTASDSIQKRDNSIVTCESFYNSEIKAILPNLETPTNDKLTKILNVTNVTALQGLDKIALANISSDIFAGTTEQLTIFALNAASAPLIEAAIDDYYRGTGISGQAIANNITAAKSTAKLQTEGLGQFKWMAQILPYAMHFLFSIIIAASILALIFVLAKGFDGGINVAKNYFVGFFQFESIRVSLALVNNIVLYYSVVNAADNLVEFGDNPLAISRIPGYLDYIATQEGVMGILGITAVFLIPAIIFKGDISGAVMALQGMSRRYAGNDLETARDAVSRSNARQQSIGNMMTDEEAMGKLKKMNLSVPVGRTPVEYYQAITNDLGKMSQGIGATLSQDSMNDYSSGAMKGSVSSIAETAGYGSRAGLNNVSNVGYEDGLVKASTVNNTASLRNSSGWNSEEVGRGNALNSVGKDFQSMGTSRGVSNSEVSGFTEGSFNKGRIDANKTLGAGQVELSSNDMSAIQAGIKSSIESEIGKGFASKTMYSNHGDDVFRKISEASELIKGTSQVLEREARIEKGILNKSGTNVTTAGEEAMAIKPGEDARGMMRKSELGKNADKVLESLYNKDVADGKLSKEQLDKRYSPFRNNDGTWKTGQDFWDEVSAQKQGVFTGHNSIMLGDGALVSGGFSDGKFTGKITSGISSTIDNTTNTASGQEDKGIIKSTVKDGLTSMFGAEVANNMIAAWNSGGEFVSGIGTVMAAGYGYGKLQDLRAKARPNSNAPNNASNPNATPHTSNNTSSMTSPSNDLNNNNINSNKNYPNASNFLDETNMRTVGKNIPDHQNVRTHGGWKTTLAVGVASLVGMQSETFADVLNTIDGATNIFSGMRTDGSDYIPTNSIAASNALMNNNQNFVQTLKAPEVRQELASIQNEAQFQMHLGGQNPQRQMEIEIEEIGNKIRNAPGEETLTQLQEEWKNFDFESFQKDLKKIKRRN